MTIEKDRFYDIRTCKPARPYDPNNPYHMRVYPTIENHYARLKLLYEPLYEDLKYCIENTEKSPLVTIEVLLWQFTLTNRKDTLVIMDNFGHRGLLEVVFYKSSYPEVVNFINRKGINNITVKTKALSDAMKNPHPAFDYTQNITKEELLDIIKSWLKI